MNEPISSLVEAIGVLLVVAALVAWFGWPAALGSAGAILVMVAQLPPKSPPKAGGS